MLRFKNMNSTATLTGSHLRTYKRIFQHPVSHNLEWRDVHTLFRFIGQVVDYDTERFEEVVQPVDVVLDTMGAEIQTRSWKVVKRGGILVSVVNPPSAELAAAHGARQAFVFTQTNAAQLAEIAKLVDAEKLKTIVETTLALSDATRGQELSERGHQRGKIVLRVI